MPFPAALHGGRHNLAWQFILSDQGIVLSTPRNLHLIPSLMAPQRRPPVT